MDQPATGRVTQNVSLDPTDRTALVELAERYDGGNVSRTIRRLIRREWAYERERTERMNAPMPAPIREQVPA